MAKKSIIPGYLTSDQVVAHQRRVAQQVANAGLTVADLMKVAPMIAKLTSRSNQNG